MKATAIERECEIDESKLFGEAYLPDKWLEQDVFGLDEFFLAQINLSNFTSELLPKNGFLYFFIDARSFKKSKMRAKVRYFGEEPDACTPFNEDLFDDVEFALEKSDLGDIYIFEVVDTDKTCLLALNCEYLPFDCDFENLYFMIDNDSLKRGDFTACELKFD